MSRVLVAAVLLTSIGCYAGDEIQHAQRKGRCEGRGRGWEYVTTHPNATAANKLDSFRCVHEDTVLNRDSIGWALR